MKKATLLSFFLAFTLLSYGQKKKSKDKTAVNYEQNDSLPPVAKDSKKGKDNKKDKKAPVKTEYINIADETPVADTATKFTGLIKYKMTSDDPADIDSMYIVFGENRIAVVMFTPGYRADQLFQTTFIASFADSTLKVLDSRSKTYKTEKLADRNAGTEFTLLNHKKFMTILGVSCPEYSGDMTLKDGEAFEAACLISKQHSYLSAVNYNFLNIQPVVLGYRIVLGWRTKSQENENSYIVAYKIEKGTMDSYFDKIGRAHV